MLLIAVVVVAAGVTAADAGGGGVTAVAAAGGGVTAVAAGESLLFCLL